MTAVTPPTMLTPAAARRAARALLLALCVALIAAFALACERTAGAKAKLPADGQPTAEGGAASQQPVATRAADAAPSEAQPRAGAVPQPATDTAPPPVTSADGSGDGSAPALAPFTGRSQSHRRSVLTPRMGGIIAKMHVRAGDVVEKGQTLVTFDTSDYTMRVRAAEAGLRVANAQKSALETEWQRLKELSEGGAIPVSQFEQLDGQLNVATAGIGQARVGVSMARKALDDAIVVAPYRSVVMAKMASEGEYAASMPPTPLAMLEEIDPLDVHIGIPEASMREAAVGDCLEVTFPAVAVVRTARITEVIPTINPMTRTFAVIVTLPNPDHMLPPGMFATARIVGASACPPSVEAAADAAQGSTP